MKFRILSLAAIAACGSAHALSPAVIDADRTAGTLKEVVIHGGSAQAPLFGAYMASICNTDLDTFFNSGGSGTGKDYRAYSCTLKATTGYPKGTPVLVVKRDLGGSIYGVNPVALQVTEQSMIVDSTAGNCVSTGQAANAFTASYNCAKTDLRQAVAGISDVEPSIFNKVMTVGTTANVAFNLPAGNDDNGTPWTVLTATQLAALDSSSANQTIFGVGVSVPLRNALQAAQGLTVGSDAADQTPSMPRAFYTALASGFVKANSTATKFAGWDALTGVASDNALQVNLCRRANGSGTQASSNLLFLEAGTITTTSNGAFAPINANGVAIARTGSPLSVTEGSSTGAAISCLTTASGLNAYAAGIISFENDPSPVGGGALAAWRFVGIDGQAPDQQLARKGLYPYVYSATMQWKKTGVGIPDTATKGFLTAMRKNLGSPTGINALAGFNVFAQRGVLAAPSSYTGTCASQAAGSINQKFGSCVERLDTLSQYNDGALIYGGAVYKTNSSQQLHVVK